MNVLGYAPAYTLFIPLQRHQFIDNPPYYHNFVQPDYYLLAILKYRRGGAFGFKIKSRTLKRVRLEKMFLNHFGGVAVYRVVYCIILY